MEKKHAPITAAEARHIGYRPAANDPYTKSLRARLRADQIFNRLEKAEQEAAQVIPPQGVPREGKLYRTDQLRRDATRLGYAGYDPSRAHTMTKDPEINAAAQRLRARGEMQGSAAKLERLTQEYAEACLSARSLTAEAAAARHRENIDAKRREVEQATADLRAQPNNHDRAARLRTVSAELETLITQSTN
jgi:hypothetical protein